ncbi:DUF445 domain-containing protein [Geoglobus sp.]
MKEWLIYLVPPFLGALIGYLTNVVAIKLLFHPRKPVRILGIKIQGLVPAKSEEFAVRFVELIEDYVRKEDFRELIDEAIGKTLRESKLLKFLMNPVIESILEKYGFREKISEHVDGLVRRSQVLLSSAIVENMDFKKFLEKKIAEFSEEEAELIFKRFAKKEMRFIEISGAVLGFIIGLVQTLFLIVAY